MSRISPSTAPAAVVTPLRPVPTPKPQRPPSVPDRPASTPFWLATPKAGLEALVAAERELLRLTGRPLSWEAAVADYLVETDRGRSGSDPGEELFGLEDRAARYGWAVSKATMSRRMSRLREDAADRRSTFSAQRNAQRDAKRQAEAQRFGAPFVDALPSGANPEVSGSPGGESVASPTADGTAVQPDETVVQRDETESAPEAPKTASDETAVQPDETVVQRRETGAPHIPRAYQTPDPEGMEDEDARRRAREACGAWDIHAAAIIAEAEDRAAELVARRAADASADLDPQLVRSALRLGMTGVPLASVRKALAALDAPARAALVVAVLRTGRAKSTAGLTTYLLSLASTLHDHDTARRYADANPEGGPADGSPGGSADGSADGSDSAAPGGSAAQPNAGAAGRAGGSVGAPGGAGAGRPSGGAGRGGRGHGRGDGSEVRGTAAQRASSVTVRSTLDGLARHRARTGRAGADDAPAADARRLLAADDPGGAGSGDETGDDRDV